MNQLNWTITNTFVHDWHHLKKLCKATLTKHTIFGNIELVFDAQQMTNVTPKMKIVIKNVFRQCCTTEKQYLKRVLKRKKEKIQSKRWLSNTNNLLTNLVAQSRLSLHKRPSARAPCRTATAVRQYRFYLARPNVANVCERHVERAHASLEHATLDANMQFRN